jgi:hypothetical protein
MGKTVQCIQTTSFLPISVALLPIMDVPRLLFRVSVQDDFQRCRIVRTLPEIKKAELNLSHVHRRRLDRGLA